MSSSKLSSMVACLEEALSVHLYTEQKREPDLVPEPRDKYYNAAGVHPREVAGQWQHHGIKPSEDMVMVPVHHLMKHREYKWHSRRTRGEETSASGKPTEHWSELEKSIKEKGWTDNPAHVMVDKRGKIKVGEGNHRLAVAKSLGVTHVPVRYHPYQNVSKSKPAREVKRAAERLAKRSKPAT